MPAPWERRRRVYRRSSAYPVGQESGDVRSDPRLVDNDPRPVGAVDPREHDKRVDREAEARREAYERGRRDARKDRKSHPILFLALLALAALGAAFIVLSLTKGSTSEAGRTIGDAASTAADRTGEAARDAADAGGEALQDTGRQIEARGENPPPAGQGEPQTQTTTTETRTTEPAAR